MCITLVQNENCSSTVKATKMKPQHGAPVNLRGKQREDDANDKRGAGEEEEEAMDARSASLGVLVGAAASAAILTLSGRCSRGAVKSQDGHGALENHPCARRGLPQTSSLRAGDAFISNFDYRTRNPAWVIERLSSRRRAKTGTDHLSVASRKHSTFHEDTSIAHPHLRSTNDQYAGSGYDRGHMAPAADHKGSQEEMNATFCLSNVAPQVGTGFNRDYWARFEKFVRDLTKVRCRCRDAYDWVALSNCHRSLPWQCLALTLSSCNCVPTTQTCDEVYVTTGPLYLPTPAQRERPVVTANTSSLSLIEKEADGRDRPSKRGTSWKMAHPLIGEPPSLVAVPTHFYKVILAETNGGDADVLAAAFVLPNAPIDASTPLRSFLVPIESLEAAAGCKFHEGVFAPETTGRINERAIRIRESAKGGGKKDGKLPKLVGDGFPNKPVAEGKEIAGSSTVATSWSRPGANGKVGHLCDSVTCDLAAPWNWARHSTPSSSLSSSAS